MVADTIGVITHKVIQQMLVEPNDFIGMIYDADATNIVIPRMREDQVCTNSIQFKFRNGIMVCVAQFVLFTYITLYTYHRRPLGVVDLIKIVHKLGPHIKRTWMYLVYMLVRSLGPTILQHTGVCQHYKRLPGVSISIKLNKKYIRKKYFRYLLLIDNVIS